MVQKTFKYIFGPVYSWRLGMSLGIDPISTEVKTCNFNCTYCQLGETIHKENSRKVFVKTKDILSEVKEAPADNIDFYTLSGIGEPTLAENIGDIISGIRSISNKKIAVITNSSLMNSSDVREDLKQTDLVLAKIDCFDDSSLKFINSPAEDVVFNEILEGLKIFRREFKGKFALQIMFVEKNISLADKIAQIAKGINPDEVQINTPLRPSNEKPLNEEQLSSIKKYFDGLKVVSVYDSDKKKIEPMDRDNTVKRHGSY